MCSRFSWGLLGFLRVPAVLAVFLGVVFTAHPPGQGDAARELCARRGVAAAGWVVGVGRRRRRVSVILRFCKYELDELDHLVQEYGGLPQSSLVNIAIEEFLHPPKEQHFQMCTKRKVNLALRPKAVNELSQYAKTYKVHRTDLIRPSNSQPHPEIHNPRRNPETR